MSFLIISANQFENLYVPHGIQLSASEFLRNITFVIGTGLSHAKLLNEPSWSISVEFWLSACLLYFLFRLPSFAIIFVSVLCYIIVFSFGRGTMIAHDTFFYLSTGMYRGVAGMAVGGLMYRHSQWFQKLTASIAARWCDLALSVFFFIILIGIYMGAGPLWDAAMILAFTPFLVVRFVDRAEWIKGFLSSLILIWLGQISVSVYLVHTPLIIFLFPRGIIHGYSLLFIGIITLITTLVLSTISYRFFELPVQRIASIIVRRFQHVVGSRMVKL